MKIRLPLAIAFALLALPALAQSAAAPAPRAPGQQEDAVEQLRKLMADHVSAVGVIWEDLQREMFTALTEATKARGEVGEVKKQLADMTAERDKLQIERDALKLQLAAPGQKPATPDPAAQH